MPHILLVDIEPGPRIGFRLTGTAVTRWMGSDFKGRYLDEIYSEPERVRYITELYREMMDARRPVFLAQTYVAQDRFASEVTVERLNMPLVSTDGAIDMAFVVQVRTDSDPTREVPWAELRQATAKELTRAVI